MNGLVLVGLLATALGAGVGCISAGADDLFVAYMTQVLTDSGVIDANSVNIRIVNQTGQNVQLNFLVDGFPQAVNCTSTMSICDEPIAPCPQTVQATSERRTDDQGYFQGGRDFTGSSDEFTFTTSDFDCGDIILFTITTTSVTASVL